MSDTQFKQIRKVTVAEQVAEQILDIIRSGEYKPGDKLPSQKELEQMMHISRPTLREAISRLISSEVIEARQGQGYFVCEPQVQVSIQYPLVNYNMRQLRDLFEARLFFEASLAQLAAAFATDDEIAQMQDFIRRVERDELTEEERPYGANYLHLLVAKFAHNKVLADFETSLLEILQQNPQQVFLSENGEDYRSKYEIDPHERIVDAIARHDPQAAYIESFEHILRYTNDMGMQDKYQVFIRGMQGPAGAGNPPRSPRS